MSILKIMRIYIHHREALKVLEKERSMKGSDLGIGMNEQKNYVCNYSILSLYECPLTTQSSRSDIRFYSLNQNLDK